MVTNAYTLRSRASQSWETWGAWQGLYFRRSVARAANLRLYLFGSSGWQEGPIYPHDPFSIRHGAPDAAQPRTVYIDGDLSHAIFIWNIFGLDVAVLIENPANASPAAALRLITDQYPPSDPCDDTSGSIDYEVKFPTMSPATFNQGQVRTYSVNLRIGTLPQLAAMGYMIPTVSDPPSGLVTNALKFYPVTPCRVFDSAASGGIALAPSEERRYVIAGHCGIPSSAKAVARNVTAVPQGSGYVTIIPGDGCTARLVRPAVNVSAAKGARANNGIDLLPIDIRTTDINYDTNAGSILVRNDTSAPLRVVYDVTGYFH